MSANGRRPKFFAASRLIADDARASQGEGGEQRDTRARKCLIAKVNSGNHQLASLTGGGGGGGCGGGAGGGGWSARVSGRKKGEKKKKIKLDGRPLESNVMSVVGG